MSAPMPVPCPDCGSLKPCDHDHLPPPEALIRYDKQHPRFPDCETRDREWRRQLGAAGLDKQEF